VCLNSEIIRPLAPVGQGKGNSRQFKVNQIDCGIADVMSAARRRHGRAHVSARGSNTSLVVNSSSAQVRRV
jgi:hypothetical protein